MQAPVRRPGDNGFTGELRAVQEEQERDGCTGDHLERPCYPAPTGSNGREYYCEDQRNRKGINKPE